MENMEVELTGIFRAFAKKLDDINYVVSGMVDEIGGEHL